MNEKITKYIGFITGSLLIIVFITRLVISKLPNFYITLLKDHIWALFFIGNIFIFTGINKKLYISKLLQVVSFYIYSLALVYINKPVNTDFVHVIIFILFLILSNFYNIFSKRIIKIIILLPFCASYFITNIIFLHEIVYVKVFGMIFLLYFLTFIINFIFTEIKSININGEVSVYIDLDNLIARFYEIGKDLPNILFFEKLKKYFQEKKDIIISKLMIYSNLVGLHDYENILNYISENNGIIRHGNMKGKNVTDSFMISDIMSQKSGIYIIITNDKDFIPIINRLKECQKKIYLVISRLNGKSLIFGNRCVFLDEIVNMEPEAYQVDNLKNLIKNKKAKNDMYDILFMLIFSKVWQRLLSTGEPINIKEYMKNIIVKENINYSWKLLELAYHLEYVTLYYFKRKDKKLIGIKEGPKLGTIKAHLLDREIKKIP